MKLMKKLLAALLAAATLVTMAVPAMAADDLKYQDIVNADGEKAIFNGDTVKPGDKYYIVIGPSSEYGKLLNRDWFRFSLKKRDGGKYISGTELVEKKLKGKRYIAIEFDARDNFTTDENKVRMEAIFKAQQDLWIDNMAESSNGDVFPKFVNKEPTPKAAGRSNSNPVADLKNAETALANAIIQRDTLLKELQTLATSLGVTASSGIYPSVSITLAEQAEYDKNDARIQALPALILAEQAKLTDLNKQIKQSTDAGTPPVADKVTEEALNLATAHLTKLGFKVDGITTVPASITSALLLETGLTVDFNKTTNEPDAADPDITWKAWNDLLTTYKLTYPTDDIPALTFVEGVDAGVTRGAVGTKINTVASSLYTEYVALKFSPVKPLAAAVDVNALQAQANQVTADIQKMNSEKATLQSAVDTFKQKKANVDAYNAKATLYNPLLGSGTGSITDLTTKRDNAQKAYNAYENSLRANDANKLAKGDEYTVDFTVWIQNQKVEESDANFIAGEKGVVIRPVKNEENTITWENSIRSLARITFIADSSTDYICPRLSTKWNNEDYLDYFDGQDAYLLDFAGNPNIPATTRGLLELYNPFIDNDDEYYHDVRDLYLYQVLNGKLKEITDFTAKENDDGDEVLVLKTRTLGTYIVCEEKIKLKEESVEKPSDNKKPSIIIDANQKPIPNTGR